jgi:hypothetical protein
MKTKLQILITVFSIALAMPRASAQQPVPIDPQTGLPMPGSNIDPATGLPLDGSPPFKDKNGSATWIDPAWQDPESFRLKVLPSVGLPQLPLSEVARYMREQFDNYFDVILPTAAAGIDPTQVNVELQLKNVTASEIFSAMNTQFELDRSPLRWELTFNGKRPTAILRYLPQLAPSAPPLPPPPPEIRKVFYVGDILDDYPGADEAAKLASIETNILSCATGKGVVAVWGGKPRSGVKIAEYPPGELLIVSGTADEVDLAEQTLLALKDKAAHDKTQPRPKPVNSQ